MSFLNPLLLFGLAGMAVPVVIHLLSRRTARRVEFSSLEFLRDLEKKSLRRLRTRQLLLLLVRMAIVGCVAVAMARPVLSGASGGGRGSTSAVVILDGSHSMGARHDGSTVFDAARDRTLEILGAFETGDEVTLLLPGTAEESQARSVRDPDLVRERVAAARAGSGPADLTAAVAEAAAILEGARYASREIHVVSDFQRSGWPRLEEAEPLPSGVRLFLVPAVEGRVPVNAWVESVDFSGQILEKGSPVEFRTVVASGPGFGPAELEIELEIDGGVVDRRRIDLGPDARVSVTFRETFGEDGLHLGKVSLAADDDLPGDDVRWFTLRTARAVPVLLVAGEDRAARYLRAALSPQDSVAGAFSVRLGQPADLVSASRDREAVTIVSGIDRLGEDELGGIKRYLSEGGGLIVFPGATMDAAAWGRSFLPRFLPGRLSDLIVSESGFTLGRLDPTHPLFDLFRDEQGGISEARFTRALALTPEPGSTVLASYANGQAAILESSLLPGRVLFFTSAPDPAWSDLPLTGMFLPLLHECVRYLSESGAKAADELEVGEGATVRLARVPDGAVTLDAPDGESRGVAPEAGPGGYALRVPSTDEPGFWTFRAGADTLAALAASVSALEADPARVPPEDVLDVLGGRGATVIAPDASPQREVREARVGREIGRWFLWAAAFLLMAEMLLASRRGPTRVDVAAGAAA